MLKNRWKHSVKKYGWHLLVMVIIHTMQHRPHFLSPPLILHLESFPHLRMGIYPFICRYSAAFSTHGKMKSGYTILSLADSQNVRSNNVLPHPNATATTPFYCWFELSHSKITVAMQLWVKRIGQDYCNLINGLQKILAKNLYGYSE